MGCWNATCALSNLHIRYSEPVYVFVLHKIVGSPEWEPIMLPIEATYDEYGSFENWCSNFDYVLEQLSKYNVVDDINGKSSGVKVDADSLCASWKDQLIIEEDDYGFLQQLSFTMIKKNIVDSLLETLTLKDECGQWEFSWKSVDEDVARIVKSCRREYDTLNSYNLAGASVRRLLMGNSPDFWGCDGDFKNVSGAVKLLSAHWGDIHRGLVDTTMDLIALCTEGHDERAADVLKNLLLSAFICETMRITRKPWQPGGVFAGSQSRETSGHLALCKAIEEVIYKEL